MKKLWIKGDIETQEYYTLASGWNNHEVYEKNSLTESKIHKIIKNREGFNRDWGHFVDTYTNKKDWPKDATDLPPGVYTLKEADNAPMRLECTPIRDDNYLPMADQKALVEDMRLFLKSAEIYKQLDNSIYRRGYLLYGEPGTGKTAFIRNLVKQSIFKNAHIIWLDFIPPTNFLKALSNTGTLKVLIMEELLGEGGNLSYEMKQLLDFMDGEHTIPNSITIATTNYPHFLHKNLADRPSRFDILFEMKRQPENVIKNIMERWLKRPLGENEFDMGSYTLAQLKEICLLHMFHNISLKAATVKLKDQSEKFKNNFTEKKEFGLMGLTGADTVNAHTGKDFDSHWDE